MADIKVLKGKKSDIEQANEEIDETLVLLLETMVLEARDGRIKNIVGVILKDGSAVPFSNVLINDELKMLGALDILKDFYKTEHLDQYSEYEDD